jgi:signal transduction histidine kinase/CheY-like chemotaxis protein
MSPDPFPSNPQHSPGLDSVKACDSEASIASIGNAGDWMAGEEAGSMHLLLGSVFELVPVGLCIADKEGIIRQCNRFFLKTLGIPKAKGFSVLTILGVNALQEGSRDIECKQASGMCVHVRIAVTTLALTPEAHMLVAMTDQTEHLIQEAKLREAQRLDSLCTLAGGIAHDFNNLLAIILGYASMLKLAAPDNPRVIEYGETIMEAGRRGADVVRQLMLYANQHEPLLVQTDAHSVLGDVLVKGSSEWPARIQLECKFFASKSTLLIDAEQIGRAVEHLLKNAVEAIPDSGLVTLRTADREPINDHEGAFRWLEISVEDNGQGMDESTRQRMFEPFFVHKKGPEVRGLGLPMVYGIIRAHRGKIEVRSTPGAGTTVTILLPHLAPSAQQAPPPPGPQIYELTAGATILLVEDEDSIARLWTDLLTKQGWGVHWARDGEEALSLFGQNKDTIDLLFSDIGLPGDIDGWEVCARIRTVKPGIPVMLASGYFRRNAPTLPYVAAPVAFVDKPYQPSDVLDKMRALLGQIA